MDRQPLISAERRRALRAAVARILPSGDGPGALETHVDDYIENAMRDPWNRPFRPLLDRGLDFLDHLAREEGHEAFGECPTTLQDGILRRVQEFPNNDARRFFQRLVELTLEGFLCDPVHGGNRDRLGWVYIDFEPDASSSCSGSGRET